MAALDYVWALYTYAIGNKNPWLSGCYAGGIILLSGIATVGYVSDTRMMVPAMLGAFVGTFVAVKRSAD